jgi:hypothetical protein
MKCPKCNFDENPDDADECFICGAELAPPPTEIILPGQPIPPAPPPAPGKLAAKQKDAGKKPAPAAAPPPVRKEFQSPEAWKDAKLYEQYVDGEGYEKSFYIYVGIVFAIVGAVILAAAFFIEYFEGWIPVSAGVICLCLGVIIIIANLIRN